MSNNNYTDYRRPNKNRPKQERPVVEQEVLETPDVIVETELEAPAIKTVVGRVTGCNKLNVRKEPRAIADIVCEIDNNTKVTVYEDESTDEFYKVCLPAGIEGFCMRKYIVI